MRHAPGPRQPQPDRSRVVVVAALAQQPVRVRTVHEHVDPRAGSRQVDVLAVEVGRVPVGEPDGRSLLDRACARRAGGAVPEERRAARSHAARGAVVVGEAEAGLAVGSEERAVARAAQLVAREAQQVPVRVRRRPGVAQRPGVAVRLEAAAGDADELARLHARPGAQAADPERAEADAVDGGLEPQLVPARDPRHDEPARRALVEVGQQLGGEGDASDVDAAARPERSRDRAVRRVGNDVLTVDNDQFGPVREPHGGSRAGVDRQQPHVGRVRSHRRDSAGLVRERDPPAVW